MAGLHGSLCLSHPLLSKTHNVTFPVYQDPLGPTIFPSLTQQGIELVSRASF